MARIKGDTYATVSLQGRNVELTQGLGRIDLDDLRTEITHVGEECVYWGVLSAQSRRRANGLKLDLDILTAKLGSEKRSNHVQRAEKFTVDQVRDEVTLDPRYKAAYDMWLQADEAANMIESAKYTVARKQSTLENLVGLLMQETAATAAERGTGGTFPVGRRPTRPGSSATTHPS